MFIQEKWINRNLSLISHIQQADETATDDEEANSKDGTWRQFTLKSFQACRKVLLRPLNYLNLLKKRQEFCPIIPGKVNSLFDM